MPYPTKRTPEVVAEILRRLGEGEPLAAICRDEGMPSTTVWGDWRRADEALDIAHARARDDGYDKIASDALEIADNGSNDWMAANDPENPGFALNREHIQRSKLRVETRLKLLAKWDPKRYGDKLDMTSGGEKLPTMAAPVFNVTLAK